MVARRYSAALKRAVKAAHMRGARSDDFETRAAWVSRLTHSLKAHHVRICQGQI